MLIKYLVKERPQQLRMILHRDESGIPRLGVLLDTGCTEYTREEYEDGLEGPQMPKTLDAQREVIKYDRSHGSPKSVRSLRDRMILMARKTPGTNLLWVNEVHANYCLSERGVPPTPKPPSRKRFL